MILFLKKSAYPFIKTTPLLKTYRRKHFQRLQGAVVEEGGAERRPLLDAKPRQIHQGLHLALTSALTSCCCDRLRAPPTPHPHLKGPLFLLIALETSFVLHPPVSVPAANLITLGPLAVRGLAGSLWAHSRWAIHTVPSTRDPRGPVSWTSVSAVYLPQARNTSLATVNFGSVQLLTLEPKHKNASTVQNNKPDVSTPSDIALLCLSRCLVLTQISSDSPLSCQRPPSIDGACFSAAHSDCTTYSSLSLQLVMTRQSGIYSFRIHIREA